MEKHHVMTYQLSVKRSLILLFSMCLVFTGCDDREHRPGIAHDITIRETPEGSKFYNQQSLTNFVPRGCNLLGADGPTIFDVGVYEHTAMGAKLLKLKSYGYNTVRVFINAAGENGISDSSQPDGSDEFSPGYIINLYQFLDHLDYYDMQVIFTKGWLPDTGLYGNLLAGGAPDFDNLNRFYLYSGGQAANKLFWKNFARRMSYSPHAHHIMAYEIQNEFFYDRYSAPFDQIDNAYHRVVQTADGNTYDMTDPVQRQRMMDSNMLLFFEEIKAAIREVDPEVLVSAGLLIPYFEKWVNPELAMNSDALDFIDLHIYPHEYYHSFEDYVTAFGLTEEVSKPILIGEFGAIRTWWSATASEWRGYQPDGNLGSDYVAARDLVNWQMAMCQYGIQGWLTWDYDAQSRFFRTIANTEEQEEIAERISDPSDTSPKYGYVGYYLAPLVRPDACSSNVAFGPRIQF